MSKQGFKENWHWLLMIFFAISGLIYSVYVLANPIEKNNTTFCIDVCDMLFDNVYDKSTIAIDGYSRTDCSKDCSIHFSKEFQDGD